MDCDAANPEYFQVKSSFKSILMGWFTEYETPKLVLIRSVKFALLLRFVQIVILTYSVLYLLIYKKGYQKKDATIISSVTLKVKGIGHTYTPENEIIVIDAADYIIPPLENNAVFIMTSFVQTHQIRSKCPESKIKEAICRNDSDCLNKPFIPNMSGHWTGRCLPLNESTRIHQINNVPKVLTGLCEYAGWCPTENNPSSDTMFINGTLNYTIFIKAFIEFPLFGVKHKNLADDYKTCTFHREHNPDCPIFTLGYILDEAECDAKERDLMLRYGGVIRVKLDWDCNLDQGIKLCKPKYSFARLDSPFREKSFSVGYNFRFANAWKHNDAYSRTLTKAFGLRFVIVISGHAEKFDLVVLTLNIGSLVGIFGLSTFLCNIVLLHLSKRARVYRDCIFERVQLRNNIDSSSIKLSTTEHDRPADVRSNSETNSAATSTYATPQLSRTCSRKAMVIYPVSLLENDLLND